VFAASWSIGFVLGVLPAGAGPREAAFILLFSATMPPAQATVLALVSRLLITLGDVAWGVLALIGIRKPPATAPQAEPPGGLGERTARSAGARGDS
jgi:uncharacterized membrane protein YbhN (UPF0104 family)